MILLQLLLVSGSLIVSSLCQEFDNYDYENSPNSVEFGAPSHTPRPTTRSPSPPPRTTPTTRPTARSPSPPYWWMNSTTFNKINQTSVAINGKPVYKPVYKP